MGISIRWLTMDVLFSGCLLVAAAGGAEQTLQVGDIAPDIQCLDDQGQIWSSRSLIGKRAMVVYFYPSDFAFCCTRQAVRYRDCQRELAEQGVEVVGISGDAVAAHQMFKTSQRLNFTLLSDRDGGVARQFGVPLRAGGKAMIQDANGKALVGPDGKAVEITREITAARWTFIIGIDGRILHRETAASPVKDSREALEFLAGRNSQ